MPAANAAEAAAEAAAGAAGAADEAAIAALVAQLGDGVVDVSIATRDAARVDHSGHRSDQPPLAVVHARSTHDVQTVMRIATEHRVAVVPRGAGTGLAGGAIGGAGEIVLSLAQMDALLEVSVDDELCVVQPGILNGRLNDRLAEYDLWFAPDPASKAISSVGGNIATNAGGLLCAKYGVTREAVLALTVVLADGTVVETGHRTVKGVTGLDLTALMVGSEGTLGVVTEATLRTRRRPHGTVATLSAAFDDVVAAAAAATAVTVAGIRPAALELLDEGALEAIGRHLDRDLLAAGRVLLLVQTDGASSAAEADETRRVLERHGGRISFTTDPAEGEELLAVRRAFHASLEALGTVLIEDVCVPRSQLAAMVTAVREIGMRRRIAIPTVAHAGDGNLHPNFVIPPGVDGVPDAVWDAADEVFRAALALGGTLTGEHGVGLLKRRWLADELGEPQVELQRRIKAAFDPLGLLNPGKVF